MDSEKIPDSLVGDDENFVRSMGVEMAIAKLELGDKFEERAGDWVHVSSRPIKAIFDRRASEEPDFLRRCTFDTDSVAKEISEELKQSES